VSPAPATFAASSLAFDGNILLTSEDGDLTRGFSESNVHGELGEIVSGSKPGRTSPRAQARQKHYSFIVRHCAAYYGRPTAFALLSRLVTSSCSAWSDSSGFEKK
jgi:hypothetical protein